MRKNIFGETQSKISGLILNDDRLGSLTQTKTTMFYQRREKV